MNIRILYQFSRIVNHLFEGFFTVFPVLFQKCGKQIGFDGGIDVF